MADEVHRHESPPELVIRPCGVPPNPATATGISDPEEPSIAMSKGRNTRAIEGALVPTEPKRRWRRGSHEAPCCGVVPEPDVQSGLVAHFAFGRARRLWTTQESLISNPGLTSGNRRKSLFYSPGFMDTSGIFTLYNFDGGRAEPRPVGTSVPIRPRLGHLLLHAALSKMQTAVWMGVADPACRVLAHPPEPSIPTERRKPCCRRDGNLFEERKRSWSSSWSWP
jgi:hypothetical protein